MICAPGSPAAVLAAALLLAGKVAAIGLFGTGTPARDRRPPSAPPVGPPAPPAAEESAPGEPVNLEEADVMRTLDLGGRVVRELQGHVRVRHRGRVFTFELGRYDQEAGLLTCTGRVRVTEGVRVLTADEVSYDERRETVSARGHVHSWGDSLEGWAEKGYWFNGLKQGELQVQARLLDQRHKVELRAGQVDADHERGVYTATRAPEMTLLEELPTTLQARQIQWRRQDSLAVARREVRLVRDDLTATCDSLVWHDRRERMEFLKSPVLTRSRQTVRGERIEALLRGRRDLDSLWVEGAARLESPADSVSSRLTDVLQGRRLEMDFAGDELLSVFVDGQARSVIFLHDEEGRPGMNVADAARMWLVLEEQKLKTVRMGGGMEARWVPIVPPPARGAVPGIEPPAVPPSKAGQPGEQ